MADSEKVIKGVEHCFHGQECCVDIECPYYIEHLSDSCCLEECQENLKADVIAMLKEQETANLYKCQNCGTWVSAENVVRCKDCKHGRLYDVDLIDCELNELAKDANFFCADGERKEGRRSEWI